MRKLVAVFAAVLGLACVANAQENSLPTGNSVVSPTEVSSSPDSLFPIENSGSPFSPDRATKASFGRIGGSLLAVNLAGDPAPATPEPSPRFLYGSSSDFRWQLAIGYEYVRFRSSAFDSNLNGLHTSLTYYTNEWFGIEGNVVAAWGTKLFADETSKYLLFSGGPRIAWRGRKWEPWAHALFGGAHVNPQIAGGFSQTGFAIQLGGGADYRFIPQLSLRFEGDYVRTQLYSTSQNNLQGGASLVFHF